MHISTISYQKTYNLGNYSSEKIGVEISINAGEDSMEALRTAKQLCDEYHKETTTSLPPENTITNVEEILPEIQQPKLSAKQRQEQTLIDSINSCTDVKVLESYRLIAKSKPKLQTSYDNKLKQLTNGLQ